MKRRLSAVVLASAVVAAVFSPAACADSTAHPPFLSTDRDGGPLPPLVVGAADGSLPRETSTDGPLPEASQTDSTAPDAGEDAPPDAPGDANGQYAASDAP
jgi:hypothetical protein